MLSVDNYIDTFIVIAYKIFKCPVSRLKLHKLVKISNLTIDNLVISLYLIHKFNKNSVVSINDKKLMGNLIIMSLILSNKIYNDQNYTFKTWINLIMNSKINLDLKMLKQLELLFLTALDYKLDYKFLYKDEDFWNQILELNPDWIIFKQFMDYDEETPINTPLPTPVITAQDKLTSWPLTVPTAPALYAQGLSYMPTNMSTNMPIKLEHSNMELDDAELSFQIEHRKPKLMNDIMPLQFAYF